MPCGSRARRHADTLLRRTKRQTQSAKEVRKNLQQECKNFGNGFFRTESFRQKRGKKAKILRFKAVCAHSGQTAFCKQCFAPKFGVLQSPVGCRYIRERKNIERGKNFANFARQANACRVFRCRRSSAALFTVAHTKDGHHCRRFANVQRKALSQERCGVFRLNVANFADCRQKGKIH